MKIYNNKISFLVLALIFSIELHAEVISGLLTLKNGTN